MELRKDFKRVETIDPHRIRNKELYEKYGNEIKKLTGPNWFSAVLILIIVISHLLCAYFFRDFSWWTIPLLAYFFGAFFSHSLYVFMHEATHNLVFKGSFANKLMNLVIDIPLIFPSSHGFRRYHMEHHRNFSKIEKDADISSPWEARFVGNSRVKKFLWMVGFMFVQLGRSGRIKSVSIFEKWIQINLWMVIAIDIVIYFYMGSKPFVYLMLSTFFALGLHPLGGRWIQEHYQIDDDQETYSYYGFLNYFTFNIGYHNEHHDVMTIPWNNLPKLKKLAPEFYDDLKSYRSWTGVIYDFIVNKRRTPYDRVIRPS